MWPLCRGGGGCCWIVWVGFACKCQVFLFVVHVVNIFGWVERFCYSSGQG